MTKSESARINGAKSHGPKTEAGRKRSSQNAIKHGLTAHAVVLPTEDPEEFQQFLTSYLDQFQPNGPAELDLIHEMVGAQWRLQRLAIIETQLYTEAIDNIEENSDEPLDPSQSLADAFSSLANSSSYNFLQRLESRLQRTYSRALRTLIQLQRRSSQPPASAPTPAENEICTNEPTDPVRPNGHFHLDHSETHHADSEPRPSASRQARVLQQAPFAAPAISLPSSCKLDENAVEAGTWALLKSIATLAWTGRSRAATF